MHTRVKKELWRRNKRDRIFHSNNLRCRFGAAAVPYRRNECFGSSNNDRRSWLPPFIITFHFFRLSASYLIVKWFVCGFWFGGFCLSLGESEVAVAWPWRPFPQTSRFELHWTLLMAKWLCEGGKCSFMFEILLFSVGCYVKVLIIIFITFNRLISL